RDARLLSAYVPQRFGGMGLSVADVVRVCESLGLYCANTAMVFAMHQIQVACIVHHALDSAFFAGVAREIVDKQLLLASATTEAANRARAFVRAEARKTPGTLPPSALRLAELDSVLFTMRSGVDAVCAEYQRLLDGTDAARFQENLGFSLRVNNLKVRSSEL